MTSIQGSSCGVYSLNRAFRAPGTEGWCYKLGAASIQCRRPTERALREEFAGIFLVISQLLHSPPAGGG